MARIRAVRSSTMRGSCRLMTTSGDKMLEIMRRHGLASSSVRSRSRGPISRDTESASHRSREPRGRRSWWHRHWSCILNVVVVVVPSTNLTYTPEKAELFEEAGPNCLTLVGTNGTVDMAGNAHAAELVDRGPLQLHSRRVLAREPSGCTPTTCGHTSKRCAACAGAAGLGQAVAGKQASQTRHPHVKTIGFLGLV